MSKEKDSFYFPPISNVKEEQEARKQRLEMFRREKPYLKEDQEQLKIMDLNEAALLLNKPNNYRVISISDPYEKVEWEYYKECLYMQFHNAVLSGDGIVLATAENCINAVDFLSKGGDCLIHCNTGKHRSTAIALGYLLTQYDYKTAIKKLFSVRGIANPNKYILRLICSSYNLPYDDILLYIQNVKGLWGI